jgi:flagellar FliJ protein
MRTESSSLPTLIDLAKTNADDAAKVLQKLAQERRNAETQLQALHDYRLDYAQRLQQATESGLSASNYHNFRQFIATLDQAISQQNKVVAQLDEKIEAGRQHWYAEKRRLSSYEALQTRYTKQRAVHENRKEQLASDETSAALYRRLRSTH